MDRETNDLIARQYLSEKNLSQVEPHELVSWAASQLEKGNDVPGLHALASRSGSDDPEGTDSLFKECIAQLGWEIPKRKAAIKLHSESILQRMLGGEMEPYDGCSHLYIMSIYLGHPDYLYSWNELFWAREDLSVEELNVLILEEAERALGRSETSPTRETRQWHHEEDEEESPGFWDRLRKLVRWL